VLLEPGAEVRPEDIPFIESAASDPRLADEEPEGDGGELLRRRDRLLPGSRRYLTRVRDAGGRNLLESGAARTGRPATTF